MIDRVDIEDVADVLCNRIVSRWDDYGLQQPTGAYERARKPLKRSDIEWHILGTVTVGAYQIAPDNLVKWIMYDVDDHIGTGMSDLQLSVLKSTLDKKDIPFYEELSGSPGSHHVWVFMEEPTPAAVAYNWARWAVRSKLGIAMFKGEIFPKQQALTTDKPFGNLVKLPMGLNRRNGNWSTFVDDIFSEEVKTVDLSSWEPCEIPDFPKGRPIQVWSGQSAYQDSGAQTLVYGDVRPCLKTLVQGQYQMGHELRRAIAMEYLAVGRMPERDIAKKCFSHQLNYDPDRTLQELRSLRGFNRPMCNRIREYALSLRSAGFNIDAECEKCIARRQR